MLAYWCTIDQFILPISYKKYFKKIKPSLKQEYILGNGKRVEYSLYLCEIDFNNTTKRVFTIFNKNSDPIVGIEFLKGLNFQLDLKKNAISLS